MTFSLLLLAHWIGDFALQSSEMASRKSHSIRWLSLHVLTYGAVLGLFSFVLFPYHVAWKYLLVNVLLHFITDFFTSKLAAQYQKNLRIFYPIIGFDQMLHMLAIFWSLQFFNLPI
jgi:hypothetical protein